MREKVWVTGHKGMVGGALVRALSAQQELGVLEIVTCSREALDLRDQQAVRRWLEAQRPTQIYIAAAKVGGIYANDHFPAEFLYDNLMIECNLIHEAFKIGVKRILFLGSSCIYPRQVSQPMKENALLTGPLEPTNEPYAIAKIAGIKLCESYQRQYGQSHELEYRALMPTNLYGLGDQYHSTHSHVIPGLIRRFHEAKLTQAPVVEAWGTGQPLREFLNVDDLAQACIFVMDLSREHYDSITSPRCRHLNVGSGQEISIRALTELIAEVVGYRGQIHFDESYPDGAARKLIDSQALMSLGWRPRIPLYEGLRTAYQDFLTAKEVRT